MIFWLDLIGTLSFTISMSFAPLTTLIIRLLSSDGEFAPKSGSSSEGRSDSDRDKWNAFRLAAGAGTLLLTCSALLSASVTSPDWLLATHALLFGAGSSLLYLSSSLLVSRYFPRSHSKHVLATSLLLAGYPLGVCWRLSSMVNYSIYFCLNSFEINQTCSSIGSLLFNPINAILIDILDWRITLRLTAILLLLIGIYHLKFFNLPARTSAASGARTSTERRDLK